MIIGKKTLLTAVYAGFMMLTAAAHAEQRLPVVASFGILGDMARVVGGAAVDVTVLSGDDQDIHAFQPTPDDVKALARAKLVILNGRGLDDGIQRLIASNGTTAQTLIVTDGVVAYHGGEQDAHAWQDVKDARIYVRHIADAFEKLAPQQASGIERRAKIYDAELKKMDAGIKIALAAIPPAHRVIVTSHAAFGFFGAAYGIRCLSPESLSTESEPSAADLAKLIQQIKTEKIHVVLTEYKTSLRLIQEVAQETGAMIGGVLYADILSKPDGPAPTYLTMMQHNLAVMVAAMKANGN